MGIHNALDLTGQIFERWTVLYKADGKGLHGDIRWMCQCSCGVTKAIVAATLRNGTSKSCGCYSTERKRTHNKTRTPIYSVWRGMLKRCNNEKHEQYPNYGGRGIRVCDRWRTFENFYADMGDAPDGHTIDRVNNNGDYEPSNCRWSTQKTQIRNKRNTAFIEYEGKQVPLAQVCETLGLPLKRTRNRIYAGWSVSDALQHKRRSKWHRGT